VGGEHPPKTRPAVRSRASLLNLNRTADWQCCGWWRHGSLACFVSLRTAAGLI